MKTTLVLLLCLSTILGYSQTINSVVPSTGQLGTASLPVTISGVNNNFDLATSTVIQFNQGSNTTLGVNSVNSVSSNSIEVDLQITNIDNVGLYDVDVYSYHTSGMVQSSLPQGFEVLNGNSFPYIVTSTPQTATLNQTLPVSIITSGTQLTQATNTSVWFNQGTSTVYPFSQTVVSDSSMVGNFFINPLVLSIGDTLDLNVFSSFDGQLSKTTSLIITPSTSLSGTVFDQNSIPEDCVVELFQRYQSYNNQYSYILFDTVLTTNGQYYFTNLPADYYVIRAVPYSTSGSIATYYSSTNPNAFLWTDAEEVSSIVPTPYNIQLGSSSSQIGTGSISGNLTSADGLVKSTFPVENARITCASSTNFYETFTDANGNYSFSTLPFDTYTIVVDIPGKTHSGTLGAITLSSSNPSVTGNNYFVYMDNIIRSFVSIEEQELNPFNIYPNPSKDYVYLEFEGLSNAAIPFNLFDINGRLVRTIVCMDKITRIDIQNLSSGKYFLSGVMDNRIYILRIVKE